MNAIQTIDTAPALPVAQIDPGSLLAAITKAAGDPNVSIDKMERLFAMHKDMEGMRRQSAYQAAMATCQAEIGPVTRDRTNTHTKSKYATLEAIDAAIRPIYTRHGFALSFGSESHATGVTTFCDILHSEGHRERRTMTGALDGAGTGGTKNKTDIQALGSTTSYLRRYLTCMVFNIAVQDEDTDGNAHVPRQPVSREDAEAIRDKLETAGLSEVTFCKRFGIANVNDLPASRYDEAERRIQDFVRNRPATDRSEAHAG